PSLRPLTPPMNRRLRQLLWLLAAAAPLAAGASWLVLGRTAEPPPDLDEICAHARAGRFDQAQAILARFLAAFPGHSRGHLLMGQFATDRPAPQPELALEHLQRVRPETPRTAAVVRFSMGKAYFQQGRFDLAESCWEEALRLDPL